MVFSATSTSSEPPRVLIVEDEAHSRRAMESLFRLSGYEPIAVGSAEEALDVIDREKLPQVALVDLDLPGMDGISFIREMSTRDPRIRSMLVTATSRERLDSLLRAYEVQYMRKPVDFQRVLDLLEIGQTRN